MPKPIMHTATIKELSISSLFVLECSFHSGYKWVLANLSMTRGKIEGTIIFCVGIESPLWQGSNTLNQEVKVFGIHVVAVCIENFIL